MVFDAARIQGDRARGWLAVLAARRWIVLFFLLTAVCSLGVAHGWGSATALMTVPFALLSINLLAALTAHPRFRADLPLLLFHLALLALVFLLLFARLIYFDGTTALGRGSHFDGTLLTEARGPWHDEDVTKLNFSNEGFTAETFREGAYRMTYNRVGWQDEHGIPHLARIGDDRPLVIGNYRIYTTAFRGFNPVFEWHSDDGGLPRQGGVQLGYKGQESFGQAAQWTLPNAEQVWIMLDFPSADAAPKRSPTDPLADKLDHTLVIRIGDERHVLTPGETLRRPGGTLLYRELDTWMGYRIVYDPTEPWIMATILVGVCSLLWFYSRRLLTQRPPKEGAA